jgi:hypothetical protein
VPRDIGLQAIRRAADLGYAPAHVWLGRISDPLRDEWKAARIRPDAALALSAYARAQDAGAREQQALCMHLKRQSALPPHESTAVRGYCS